MATKPAAPEFGDAITTGEETYDRDKINSTAVATGSGSLRLTYFTAKNDEALTSVDMWTGGTAAGATPTLIRVGLWTANAAGQLLALVASTANDTSLLAATNTQYTKAWSAYTKIRGTRYACGLLVVTGATAPTMTGATFGGQSSILGLSPMLCGTLGGQSDLPSSGSPSAGLNRPYFRL